MTKNRICFAPLLTALVLGVALPICAEAQLGGTIDVETRLPSLRGVRFEVVGDFGFMSGLAQATGMRWDAGMRLHTTGTDRGVWFGLETGAAGIGSLHRRLRTVQGGVRQSLGPARIDVWLTSTGFGSGTSSLGQDTPQPDSLARKSLTEYTDLSSRVTFSRSRYDVGLSVTRRMGSEVKRGLGYELSATWWMTPSIGLAGSAGHSLPQLGFVVPGGPYGTMGLRLALGTRSSPRPQVKGPEARTGPALLIADRRLTVTGKPADQAEVIGDFTDWRAEPMVALGGGRWTFPVALTPGVHHLNVRFDGGAWVVPAGAFAVDDGYGGRVGLVLIR
jgi:hypothetical protein